MKEETKEALDDAVKEAFEPLYKRKLTKEEVDEIGRNLIAYAEWLIDVDARIKKDKVQEGK